ncbi:MAG: serine/threonine-protein kinase [Gammaproteobacteria bacterium]
MENIPSRIGKYEVRRVLGKGAMGVVFEGYDQDVDRRVAIKAVHEHLLTDQEGPEFLARLQREAQAAARCNHPNIVTVLEYGRDQGMHFIAMEYVDGVKLTEKLRGESPMELRQSLSIMSQLLKAVHAAHKQGIIHRDIKPDNIILLANGTVKLADFGIARLPNSEFTRIGVFMGTPRFSAPEQAEGGNIGPYSDVFSIGMVLADLLCRTRVPPNATTATIPRIEGLHYVHKINRRDPVLAVFIPIIERSLQPDYTRRTPTAAAMAQELKAALNSLGENRTVVGSNQAGAMQSVVGSATVTPLSDSDRKRVEKALAECIGPVASSLVTLHAAQTSGLNALIAALANEIADPDDRREFLRKVAADSVPPLSMPNTVAKSSPPQPAAASIDPDVIRRLREDFVNYVGPIAGTIINEHISQGSGFATLLRQMAEHIPNDQERQQFLNHWR